jgi:2-methylcitrate dehydratase PrpD
LTPTAQLRESVTIAERLAGYVRGLRFEDIPADVVARTKQLLAHHLGVALDGGVSREAALADEVARRLSGLGGRCSVIGRQQQADLLEAILANSLLMARGRRDDVLQPPGINPGAAVLPAALALAETTGASGRDLVAAIVIGYDVMARLHPPVLAWNLTVPRPAKWSVSPFGVAATAARLLGLPHEQAVAAIGHAGQAGIGLYEGAEQTRVMQGLAACGGVLAALLARAGLPGSRTVIEGQHGLFDSVFLQAVPDGVTEDLATLGHRFAVMDAEIREHPVSILNGTVIEVAQRLLRSSGIQSDQVTAVDLVLAAERQRREAVYDTPSHQRGPSFLVASVLLDGHFDPERLVVPPDDRLRRMRDKVQLRFEAGRPLRYARLEITLRDGREHVAAADGVAAVPFDWARCLPAEAASGIPAAHLDRAVELLQGLEAVPDARELTACLRPGAA